MDDQRKQRDQKESQQSAGGARSNELTVCEIIGDCGAYQLSLACFALLYSALAAFNVVVGPLWTPPMRHLCLTAQLEAQLIAPLAPANPANLSTAINATLVPPPHSLPSANFTLLLAAQDASAKCYLTRAETNDSSLSTDITTTTTTTTTSTSTTTTRPDTPDGGPTSGEQPHGGTCHEFIYDDEAHGKVLTNTFDLVCERKWLRSFPSSSALTGMLLSSVSLGVLADKYGRMRCIKLGFAISLLATAGAILAQHYVVLNFCLLLISYAQIGVANALCTLLMEASSPKWRFLPNFQYGFGWGLGVLLVPGLQALTKNYQHFLTVLLVYQLLLLIWLKFGVFESIRWLLSEGHINRAQIELQRACRMNKVRNGQELAQKIAQVQVQQVRKASSVIAQKTAPLLLAQATNQVQEVEQVAQELDMLGRAIRRSFALEEPNGNGQESGNELFNIEAFFDPTLSVQTNGETNDNSNQPKRQSLSPTLAKKSLSITEQWHNQQQSAAELIILDQLSPKARQSITTQCLVQLALKYSRTLHKQEEGTCFLSQMFHKKLARSTLVLMMLSVMLETSYFGLIQANGFVGESVSLNYVMGAIGEWIAAFIYMLLLYIFSRRVAVIIPTLCSAFVCIGIALSFHLIPGDLTAVKDGRILQAEYLHHHNHRHHHAHNFFEQRQAQRDEFAALHQVNITGSQEQVDQFIANNSLQTVNGERGALEGVDMLGNPIVYSSPDAEAAQLQAEEVETLQLRDGINFWLTATGKLTVTVGIQVAATIAMETYPNNVRQTGAGVIVFVGRIGSIAAPFLFNDHSEERSMFKITLVVLATFGFFVSLMVPFFIRDTKNKDLCDRLNEIEPHH